ncbi:Mur ligase domain-containing protein [Candidatus Wolfebacteria bacterium]|nr:Mur ligase domain-containing protein [Candidatus Wolfebacteria bacterium]
MADVKGTTKKAHFIGICGVGMSATAALMRERGYDITGSATSCYPPVRDYLEKHNLLTFEDHKRSNVPQDAEVVVAGASAALDRTQNEEVDEAHVRGIPVKTFPEVLDEITRDKENIVIAGSYGKTTCAALIAWMLYHRGKDPGYFIGALVPQLPAHGHLGANAVFVVEGDEYPTSGIDDRSKFLLFSTHDVLLTSADHDHVNKFQSHEDYLKPFRKLLARIPKDGILVACSDNHHVRALTKDFEGTYVPYGTDMSFHPLWSAKDIDFANTTSFTLTRRGEDIVNIETRLLGMHNVLNIMGAAAIVLEKKLLTPEEVASAIREFNGITRRLDSKTDKSTIKVYEGFGSSREKAMAAIAAMHAHFPKHRLVVVFEPHAFSWRNKNKLAWYDDAFLEADVVYVYHPPEIGIQNHEQATHEEIVKRLSESGVNTIPITSEKEGLEKLKQTLQKTDIVLLLTSGNLGGMVQSLPQLAETLFPKQP